MDHVILGNIEQMDGVKRWLGNMQDKGTPKHYEILMDGKRIVSKTDVLENFEQYKKWMSEFTQSLRIMVYNTKDTHRAQVFELRTEKYIEGQSNKLYATRKRSLNEDEIEARAQAKFEEQKRNAKLSELATENREIKKRLADAESYIAKLETEKAKDTFDLEDMLKMMLPTLQQQMTGTAPEKINTATELNGNEKEHSTVTYRKIEPRNETQVLKSDVLTDREQRDLAMLRESFSKAGAEKYAKLINILGFLNSYPEFIDAVNDHLVETAEKLR